MFLCKLLHIHRNAFLLHFIMFCDINFPTMGLMKSSLLFIILLFYKCCGALMFYLCVLATVTCSEMWICVSVFSLIVQNTEKVDLMEKAVKAHRLYTNMVSIGTELRTSLIFFCRKLQFAGSPVRMICG